MIGIDRPIRPEWIYETLRMIEAGAKPGIYNEPFEDIAKELVGKEGKRKARTVIFRSFIYSFQEKKNLIENNIFIEWAKTETIKELKPLFLLKILMDYEICRFTTQKIGVSIDNSNHLSMPLLFKKMVQEYGDRDVVKRSLRSFLATLIHFGILGDGDKKGYTILEKPKLSTDQVKRFLILYAKVYLKSNVVDLQSIEPEFFFFFQPIDYYAVATEYNGKDWEYVRDSNRNQLIMK